MAKIIERYNLKFHESPAGAVPVEVTANAPTAAPTAAPAAGATGLPSPPTLPPPLGRLTSKPALILPCVYGHAV